MGSSVLRGISTALLVTVLTLFAGIVWGAVGLGGLSVSLLVDIGLLASCLVGGYRTGKESGQWFMGGATGAGYVTLGTILLALFLPIQSLGFIRVLIEGAIIGLVAGAAGAGGMNGKVLGAAWQGGRSRLHFEPSYASYDKDDYVNQRSDRKDQDNIQEMSDPVKSTWMESPKEESQGRRASKWGAEAGLPEDADVEWPWDRVENQKLICSESRFSEPLVVWEPDRVTSDTMKRDRTKVDNSSVGRARPWWEE